MDAYRRRRIGMVLGLGAVLALGGCRDRPVDAVKLGLSVEGATIRIRVENRTATALQVPTKFLDKSRPHELALVVSNENGRPVGMCREIAYADGPALQPVPAGTAVTVEVAATTLMQTHCLEAGRPYGVQAVLVAGVQPGVDTEAVSNLIWITLSEPASP